MRNSQGGNQLKSFAPTSDTLQLDKKSNGACQYVSENGFKAVLKTGRLHDPEEFEPVLYDVLVVSFHEKRTAFVAYIDVESYSPHHLETFEKPALQKIKALLHNPKTSREVQIDMGMIQLESIVL